MNFEGPVRVADSTSAGNASVTLSFNSWSGAPIMPTTHTIPVLPRRAGAKDEPIAQNLSASLVHADRGASMWPVEFSPEGSRLLTSGYPSGIVQIWDVALGKEVIRIDTPPCKRATADYALLAPDWKTLYVPVEKRTVKRFERDGKRVMLVEEAGAIRVWDLSSGKEMAPLTPAAGKAPVSAKLTPSGRLLVSDERSGYEASHPPPRDATVVWDRTSGRKWTLCDETSGFSFAPDEKTVVVGTVTSTPRSSAIKLLELATGKEVARMPFPENDRFFSVGPVSPDGAVVSVFISGKQGARAEMKFLDARTLADRGKLASKGKGWRGGLFNNDGTRFIALDGLGNILLWNVAARKLESTLVCGGEARRPTLSRDGTMLAVVWMPPTDSELADALDPDPQDLPQPRVSLFDLTGKSPPRVLIAPHSYLGGIAFSPDGKTLALGGVGAVRLFDLTK